MNSFLYLSDYNILSNSIIDQYNIPKEGVMNFDQTFSKYIPANEYTLAERGVSTIKINGTNVSLTPSVNLENKKLIKIVDVLGRVVEKSRNTLLFYIYDDGSVEEKIFVE